MNDKPTDQDSADTQHEESNESKWKTFDEEAPSVDSEPAAGALDYPSHQQLEDQLTALERQLAEAKDQVLRAHAEMDNVQRRSEREISNAFKYSNNKLLGDLLPIVDSLVRGLEGSAKVEDSQLESVRQGMQLTLDLLEKTLEKYGVKPLNPTPGELFNPEFHEAMSAVPHPEFAPNSVVQVLQKGYQLHDRVLRAAMVMVSK